MQGRIRQNGYVVGQRGVFNSNERESALSVDRDGCWRSAPQRRRASWGLSQHVHQGIGQRRISVAEFSTEALEEQRSVLLTTSERESGQLD